jgi:hypothetical protein
MSLIDKYYYKIKYLILEFNNILELDSKYMSMYLNNCANDLHNNNLLEDKNNSENNENSETNYEGVYNSNIKTLYKNLAKKFHPDKNKNQSKEFIIINEAYKKNDLLTLFIYSYENNFYNKENITHELFNYLNNEIDKKEKKINEIKNKPYWHWVNSNDDLEKELINNYIKSQLYDS